MWGPGRHPAWRLDNGCARALHGVAYQPASDLSDAEHSCERQLRERRYHVLGWRPTAAIAPVISSRDSASCRGPGCGRGSGSVYRIALARRRTRDRRLPASSNAGWPSRPNPGFQDEHCIDITLWAKRVASVIASCPRTMGCEAARRRTGAGRCSLAAPLRRHRGARVPAPRAERLDLGRPAAPGAGERPGRVCAATAYLHRTPGKTFAGTVFRGQPLAIQRMSASRWARVVTDARGAGWLKASDLCR